MKKTNNEGFFGTYYSKEDNMFISQNTPMIIFFYDENDIINSNVDTMLKSEKYDDLCVIKVLMGVDYTTEILETLGVTESGMVVFVDTIGCCTAAKNIAGQDALDSYIADMLD